MCDADWAADPDDRCSTSELCIFLGPNLVSWWAKKQTLVATSTTEAEYRSLANTTVEILWIQTLLTELHVPFLAPIVYCDNLSTINLSHNPVLHNRTKHMELDIVFVREKVLAKTLTEAHIPAMTKWQMALQSHYLSNGFSNYGSNSGCLTNFSLSTHPQFEGGGILEYNLSYV